MRPGASCAPMETGMADDDLRGVIGEMKLLRVSIGGVNPGSSHRRLCSGSTPRRCFGRSGVTPRRKSSG